MKKLFLAIISIFIAVPMSAQRATSYANPVIPGYHPDPSVCRVGDDFYLVNSSFMCFPGVPVYHSRDLVNWELIGNVLTRESQLPLKDATSWLGIYAPTLRYHDGLWYMITTNVGNGGNFMVTAKKPEGPWSEPIWLKQDGIDPSLFWENGKCYMMSNPGDCIWLCEINPKTGKQLTESRPLWQGTGGRYPEGPHIYKKDGWYYLLISEGGTEMGHNLTIARSRDIWGPYESNPSNPILSHFRSVAENNQIQATGHGDFVEAPDGSWWVVFLAFRRYGGDYHHLGRETFLAPVQWDKGAWPVVNGGNPVDTMMFVNEERRMKNEESLSSKKSPLNDSSFFILHSSLKWLYIQNPLMENYEVKDGVLRLHPHGTLAENDRPTFKGVRQEDVNLLVETEVCAVPEKKMPMRAGLSVYQINDGFLSFGVENNSIVLRVKLKTIDYVVGSIPLPEATQNVKLRIIADEKQYAFAYSLDGNTYHPVGNMDCTLLSTEVAGGFTGVIIGMFAEGDNPASAVDFKYFKYQSLER